MKGPDPVWLWQHAGLTVYNKPHGMLSHGNPNTRHAVGCVALAQGAAVHVCHRLDAGTGGALLLALSQDAAASAGNMFESHLIHKQYLALALGVPTFEEKTLESPVPASPHQGGAQSSKASVTLLRVLTRGHGAALMLCEPLTGRFHQVRAHLKEAGHPVLGDVEHGGGRCPVMALHAWRVRFSWEGKAVDVTAPLWDGFLRCAAKVGLSGVDGLAKEQA